MQFRSASTLCVASMLSVASLGAAGAGGSVAKDPSVADAMQHGDKQIVLSLLKKHADVNVPQNDGATALHWAAYLNDADTADLLIRAGANVNARNNFGVSPLAIASEQGNAAIIGESGPARGRVWRIQHKRARPFELTRLDTAFSRDQPEKVYVQHRILEHAKELLAWLEEGAHFYVCGDAGRMAKDVDAYFINSSAFEASDRDKVHVIARYAKDDVLRSGWLKGEDRIKDRIALAEIGMGKGHVVLFAFRPQHRGQTWGTFPFIWNAINEFGGRN